RGACAGTPAYMAPEQREAGPVDARADQYSFCVALYEALHGQRPPEAKRGERPLLPRNRRVPGHLRRALLRGLSPAADQRFASMRELLTALTREPLAAWRVPLLSTAALGLLVVGGLLGGAWEEPSPCRGGARRWEGVWDVERQRAMREALGVGGSSGSIAWEALQGALDGYARAWEAQYTEACEATRVHGEQSEALLDARMRCLERRARDFQSLAELIARKGTRPDAAVEAAWRLPTLESCAAPHAQAALQGLPAEGPARERAESISRRLSEVRALKAMGQHVLAMEQAKRALEELEGLDHAPTRAEVFLEMGQLHMRLGQAGQAEQTLLEAAWTAEAARYDRLVAEARIDLMFVYGDMLLRPALGAAFAREAQAAVARLGGDTELEAAFERRLGGILMEQDQCAEALPHIERARVLTEKVSPPGSPPRLGMVLALGRGYQCRGELDAARTLFQQATQLRERLLGPANPLVVQLMLFEGRVALVERDLSGALLLFQRATNLLGQESEPNLEMRGVAHGMQASVLRELGRLEEARDHAQKALTFYERQGNTHPTRAAVSWLLLGEVEAKLGRVPLGLTLLERALRAAEPHDALLAANTRLALARWLFRSGQDLPRARRLALEAHRVYGSHPSTPPADLQEAAQLLGELGLAQAKL
ncbi:tetratricopeptide repeat protein, partial [Stigmatella aurantiaca]